MLSIAIGGRAVAGRADVTDGDALAAELRAVAPAAVCHLAAATSVAESWRRGAETWRVNVLGTVALLDAVRAEAPGARTLVVSTGEVYGPTHDGPAGEDAPPAPLSPYATPPISHSPATIPHGTYTGWYSRLPPPALIPATFPWA